MERGNCSVWFNDVSINRTRQSTKENATDFSKWTLPSTESSASCFDNRTTTPAPTTQRWIFFVEFREKLRKELKDFQWKGIKSDFTQILIARRDRVNARPSLVEGIRLPTASIFAEKSWWGWRYGSNGTFECIYSSAYSILFLFFQIGSYPFYHSPKWKWGKESCFFSFLQPLLPFCMLGYMQL